MAHGFIFNVALVVVSFLFTCINADELSKEKIKLIAPYIIPENHPLKATLDRIFLSSEVLLNHQTLKDAGFKRGLSSAHKKLVVVTHPALNGYVIKLYLHAQRYRGGIHEYDYWIKRIQGAAKIRHLIQASGLETLYKVPQKWIYCLPPPSKTVNAYYPKYTVLVEEDMHLLSVKKNKLKWASETLTYEFLDHTYRLLRTIGLKDCAKIDNIPFAKDGRIAFIDTQTHGETTLNYKRLTPCLSKKNQIYWKKLNK